MKHINLKLPLQRDKCRLAAKLEKLSILVHCSLSSTEGVLSECTAVTQKVFADRLQTKWKTEKGVLILHSWRK